MEVSWSGFIGAAFGAGLTFLLTHVGTRWLEAIRRRSELVRTIPVLALELRHVATRVAMTGFLLAPRVRKLDQEYVEWFYGAYRRGPAEFRSVATDEYLPRLLESDALRQVAIDQAQQNVESGVGVGFMAYETPFLDAKLPGLEGLKPASYRALIEFRTQLRMMHKLITHAEHLHEMTFTVSGSNHAKVKADYEAVCGVIFERTRLLFREAEIAIVEIEKARHI